MTTTPRIDPDQIPTFVLETIVTRLLAAVKEPRWCSKCQDRPAIRGTPFCERCYPDDHDFEGD